MKIVLSLLAAVYFSFGAYAESDPLENYRNSVWEAQTTINTGDTGRISLDITLEFYASSAKMTMQSASARENSRPKELTINRFYLSEDGNAIVLEMDSAKDVLNIEGDTLEAPSMGDVVFMRKGESSAQEQKYTMEQFYGKRYIIEYREDEQGPALYTVEVAFKEEATMLNLNGNMVTYPLTKVVYDQGEHYIYFYSVSPEGEYMESFALGIHDQSCLLLPDNDYEQDRSTCLEIPKSSR